MCVHRDVKTLSGAAQTAACKAKTDARACQHHNEVERFKLREPDFGKSTPVDIEDLVKVGTGERRGGGGCGGGGCGPCPYYLALDMQQRADVVFMPYNYLIDPKLRAKMRGKLQNAVLLFDEAHNIEEVMSGSSSFDVPAATLAAAAGEAQDAFAVAAAIEEGLHGDGDGDGDGGYKFNARRGKDDDDGYGGGDGKMSRPAGGGGGGAAAAAAAAPRRAATEYKQLRGVLIALEQRIASELASSASVRVDASGGGEELVKPGEAFFELLASLNVYEAGEHGDTKAKLLEVMRDAVTLLASDAASLGARSKSRASAYRLQEIADAIEKAFEMRRDGHVDAFRLRVGADATGMRNGGTGMRTGAGLRPGPTLSFWCFTPGVVMRAFEDLAVRSVVLTSGTLSPMRTFAAELRAPFPVRLENPHVISPGQVWGGIVPVGPSGKRLNSSYRFRDTDEYKHELGGVVVNFARVIPDGLLVFFPSYGVMRSCVEAWQTHGNPTIWDRIAAAKHPVVEPTDKASFMAAFEEFNDAIDDGAGAAGGRRGAVFFAVCRGKVSEGIDFADKAGRGVILTGIPYAPKADPKVRIKRAFLDSARGKITDADDALLSGEEWYSQTAMRAVNQALGRVIRHRDDYGAVILADERFAYGNVRGSLSVWLRPAVQSFDSFGKATAKLSQFFKRCVSTLPPPRAKAAAARGPGGADGGGAVAPTVAIPAMFKVDVNSAPQAYPRATGGAGGGGGGAGGGGGLLAALASKKPTTKPTTTTTTATAAAAAAAATTTTTRPPPAPAASDASSKSSESVKLFLRRAKSELGRKAFDDLSDALRDFREKKLDVGGVLKAATRILRARGAFYTLVPIRPRWRGERRSLRTLPGASLRPGSLAFNPDTPRCLSTPLLTPLNSTPTSLRMERPSEDPWGLYALFGAFVPAEHRATHAKHVDALQRMARERGGVGGGGGGDTAYTAAGERKRARVDDAGPAGPSGLRCVLYTSPHTTALAW